MNRPASKNIIVIGGGVAGTSFAITMGRLGYHVDLVEKATFPRDKTCGCCIGPAGIAALKTLGMAPNQLSGVSETSQWIGSLDGRRVEIGLPPGIAISRRHLDPALIDLARQAGVNIRMPASAKIVGLDIDGVTVSLRCNDGPKTDQRYDACVLAAGLTYGGVESYLPYIDLPHGPLGVSYLARQTSADNVPVQPGVIYMACDDDGYVGVVRLGDDRIDIAGALRAGGKASKQGTPIDRMQRILDESGFGFGHFEPLSGVMAAPRLRRRRTPGNGRLIAIGDSAGYVEPFTGEGMTWAMQSGIAAGELASETEDWTQLGIQWQANQDHLLKSKQTTCRRVTTLLRHRSARWAAANLLNRFPALASPLIEKLSHTPSFDGSDRQCCHRSAIQDSRIRRLPFNNKDARVQWQ